MARIGEWQEELDEPYEDVPAQWPAEAPAEPAHEEPVAVPA